MSNQSKKKYSRLLEKAEDLFWKYGYNGVSMDQIANEAGISKMTVYKHFPSKEKLFIDILSGYIRNRIDVIMKKVDEKFHTFEKIETLYTYSLEESRQFPPIMAKDIMERPTILRKITKFKQENTIALWRNLLEDGIRKGEIRPLDVEFVSNLLMNLPVSVKEDYFTDENVRIKLLENLFDFMRYGLLGGIENTRNINVKGGTGNAKKDPDEG